MTATVVRLQPPPGPHDAAAGWVARIDRGPLSAAERAELEAWLAADASHPAILDEAARAWAAALAGAKASAGPTRAGRRRALSAIAASIVAVVGAGLWWQTADEYSARISTGPGERRTVSLPDGSRLTLNTRTEIAVDFDGERRALRLSRGEAIFAVAHDPARPFTVRAGGVMAQALGTRFAVRRFAGDSVAVLVTEGRVQVADAAPGGIATVRVVAGQRVVAGRSGPLRPVVADDRAMTRAFAWSEGGIPFRDEPLAEVLAEVNRYEPRPIRLGDPALGSIRVSGYFVIGNSAAFVSALTTGTGLRATEAADGAVVLSPA